MRTRDYDYFDTKEFVPRYSFQVQIKGQWHGVAVDGKPLLFDTVEERAAARSDWRKKKESELAS